MRLSLQNTAAIDIFLRYSFDRRLQYVLCGGFGRCPMSVECSQSIR
jgi:hypothetical protein